MWLSFLYGFCKCSLYFENLNFLFFIRWQHLPQVCMYCLTIFMDFLLIQRNLKNILPNLSISFFLVSFKLSVLNFFSNLKNIYIFFLVFLWFSFTLKFLIHLNMFGVVEGYEVTISFPPNGFPVVPVFCSSIGNYIIVFISLYLYTVYLFHHIDLLFHQHHIVLIAETLSRFLTPMSATLFLTSLF